MGLQTQRAVIQLRGIDQKPSNGIAIPGTLAELSNGRMKKAGEFRKREGFTSKATVYSDGVSSLSNIVYGSVYGDELLNKSGTGELLSYSETMSRWFSRGVSERVACGQRVIQSSTGVDLLRTDVAYGGGYAAAIWVEQDRTIAAADAPVKCSIIDWTTKKVVLAAASVSATGAKPRILYINGAFVMFWIEGITGATCTLKTRKWSTASPDALTTTQTVSTALAGFGAAFSAYGVYDACVGISTDSTKAFVAFHGSNAGTSAFFRLVWDPTTNAVTTGPVITNLPAPTDFLECLSVMQSNSTTQYIVADCLNAATDLIRYHRITASTLAIASTTTAVSGQDAVNITGFLYDSTILILFEYQTASGNSVAAYKGSAPTVIGTNCGLASKTFSFHQATSATGYYTWLSTGASGVATLTGEETYILVNENGDPVQKTAYGLAYGLYNDPKDRHLRGVGIVSTSEAICALSRATKVETTVGGFDTLLSVSIVQSKLNPALGPWVSVDGVLFQPGGFVRQYAGSRDVEMGFHHSPPSPELTADATASFLVQDKTYGYVLLWSWTDELGRIQRSAAAPPASMTTNVGNPSISVAMRALALTRKRVPAYTTAVGPSFPNLKLELYRTVGDGTAYYRLSTYAANGFENNPNSLLITYLDSGQVDDDALIANEPLYTEGELPNLAPPPSSVIWGFDNRLWGVDDEDPLSVWYSKRFIPGIVPGVPDEFRVRLTEPLTAIGDMDDKIVLFSRTGIYWLPNGGPDDAGSGEYTSPTKLSIEAGCVEPKSVQKTPSGLMYKGLKGWYLLDRGLNAQYIGAQVEDYNTLTVAGVLIVEDRNEVQWYTTGGRTIIYDWHFGIWYTDTGQAACGAGLYQSKPAWFAFAATGAVNVEVAGQYNDNGAAYSMSLTLNWMQPVGIGGIQRIYEMQAFATYRAAHVFRSQWMYDYGTTVKETLRSRTQATPLVANDFELWSVRPKKQQCQALRVTIDDVLSSASEGLRLWGLALMVGVDPQVNRQFGRSKIAQHTGT